MKLRFTKTKFFSNYHGNGIAVSDGDIVDVDDAIGQRLLTDFPSNFEVVGSGKTMMGKDETSAENEPPKRRRGRPPKSFKPSEDKMIHEGENK